MVFLLEFMPEEMQKLSRKKKYLDERATVRDFLFRSCTKMLKRTCKSILAFNYLLVHRKMSMLTEVGSLLKIFVTETCDLLIEKLTIFQAELVQTQQKVIKENEQLSKDMDKMSKSVTKIFEGQDSMQFGGGGGIGSLQ